MDTRMMVVALALAATGAQADVCRWTDATGTHFADRAPVGVQAQCQAAPVPPDAPAARPPAPAGVSDRQIAEYRRLAEDARRSDNPEARTIGHEMDLAIERLERARKDVDASEDRREKIRQDFDRIQRRINGGY